MEKRFTEKESLELISQMIKQTKQGFEVGSGNILLFYGYLSLASAALVYAVCTLTHQMAWHGLWFLLFVPMLVRKFTAKRHKPEVVTYIDRAVSGVWEVVTELFFVTLAVLLVVKMAFGEANFTLMMPLSLLYVGFGVAATGVITKERSMIYTPIVAFLAGIYMLNALSTGAHPILMWNLICGLAFFVMLVIPGHILNYKSKSND